MRLTHWLFVASIALSWWSAEQRAMEWHRYSGYALLGLLIFRIYWGFVGSSTARFAEFVRGPRAVIVYLRSRHEQAAIPGLPRDSLRAALPFGREPSGHSPLGALSVVTLLALMLAQVTIGLFVTDIDGLESGPLSHLVSFDTSRAFAEVHENFFNVLLAFVSLHIAAVLFYLFHRRDDSINAMLTGKRRHTVATEGMQVVPAWRILPGVALAAVVVWVIVR